MKIIVQPSTQPTPAQTALPTEIRQAAPDRCESPRVQSPRSPAGSPLAEGLTKPSCGFELRPLTEEELKEDAIACAKESGLPPQILGEVEELETLLKQASQKGGASEAALARGKDAMTKAQKALAAFDARRAADDFGEPDLDAVEAGFRNMWTSIKELGSCDAAPSAVVATLARLTETPELAGFFDVPAESREAWLEATRDLPIDAGTRDTFTKAAALGGRLKLVELTAGVAHVRPETSEGMPLPGKFGGEVVFNLEKQDWLHGYRGGDRAMLREIFAASM